MVANSFTDEELLRYSRQILLDDWDMNAQLNLKNSTVLMVGIGGLGCPICQILVRAGVGRLHLVDFDVVDESNLQRQMLFTSLDVGLSKAKTACEKLRTHNELVQVDYTDTKLTHDNIMDFMTKISPSLVIDCTDNFAIRDLLNKSCRAMNVPLLSNSAIGEVGQIALFTSDTGCYQCLFGVDMGDETTCATSGVLGSTVAVIGSITTQVALDFLGRHHNPIANELVLWQGRTMTLRKVKFSKDENCAICQFTPKTMPDETMSDE